MSTYSPAPDVRQIASGLIRAHHRHLDGIRIEYVYRGEAARHGGKIVWGRARKKSGLDALLASPGFAVSDDLDFFVIEIARDVWGLLDAEHREALVDHELSHLGTETTETGESKLVILGHDVEEFGAVIARHGLWRPDLTEFMRAVGSTQLTLFALDAVNAEGIDNRPSPQEEQAEQPAANRLSLVADVDPETGEIGGDEEEPDAQTAAVSSAPALDPF